MPNPLARKYMRPLDWVSRREVVIGLSLLALVAAIVAAFITYSTGNRDYLFAVSNAALDAEEPPRAAFVAAELLPELGSTNWQAVDEPAVIDVVDWPARYMDVAPALEAYGVLEAYGRQHAPKDAADAVVDVLVCNMETPQQAMGMVRAVQPAGAAPLSAGMGGWITADATRAAFWSGRYYTELRAPAGVADEKLPLARIASLHADRQLKFGGPFWAQTVLASLGATDDFRYLHTDAFGVAGLDAVYAANGVHDVAAWIHDAGNPAAAQRVFGRIEAAGKPSGGAEQGHDTHGGDASGGVRRHGPVTTIPRGDAVLAFFTNGQYVQGALGGDEAMVLQAATGAYDAAMSQLVQSRAAPAPAAVDDNPFPEPDIKDWQRPRQVDRFSAENLYMKIDGRADAYLQFSVAGLAFGTYTHRREAERTVDVYMYDMAGPENAYGIYKTEFSPEGTAIAIGKEGYTVDGAVFFQKGPYYVQVLPGTPEDGETAQDIAKSIAATIADVDNVPWAERVLPSAGRRENSFAFIAQDAFGLGFLTDVYTADYDFEGQTLTLFVTRTAGMDDAAALLEKYAASIESFGKILWRNPERSMFAGDAGGLYDVVFIKGPYLAGVAGADDADAAKQAAEAFHAEMTAE